MLLLDRAGLPADAQCVVKVILATAAAPPPAFTTAVSATAEGLLVLAARLGDGWYGVQTTGPVVGEAGVPLVFMIETLDALGGDGGGDAARRFPFYATHLPPYDAYFPDLQARVTPRVSRILCDEPPLHTSKPPRTFPFLRTFLTLSPSRH